MADILAEGRAKAEAYNRDGDGFKNTGQKNAYECDGSGGNYGLPHKPGCGSFIVTIDRDPGVTPFGIRCGNCGETAHSKGYRVADWLEPTHEWYRPDSLDGIDPRYHEHLSRGGIILRPIEGREDRWSHPDAIPDKAALYERRAKMEAMIREAEACKSATVFTKQLERAPSRQERRHRRRKGLN